MPVMVTPVHTSAKENVTAIQGLHCGHGALLGPLGLFVQGLLAFAAFTALIAKRYCEPLPQRRTWKIWFFDTSKQAIGAAVLHFTNVFLADMFTGDPCTWYVVSFLLDSTLGLVVIYAGLKLSQYLAHRNHWDSLLLGEYGVHPTVPLLITNGCVWSTGNPPQCCAWVGQCGVYMLVMMVEKLLMTLLVLFQFWKEVRHFILSPIKDPHLELVIVMFIVPFIVNAFIFWVVDNFLKKNLRKTSPLPLPKVIDHHSNGMKYYPRDERLLQCDVTDTMESESDLLSCDDEEVRVRRGRGVQRSPEHKMLLDPSKT